MYFCNMYMYAHLFNNNNNVEKTFTANALK